VSSAQRRAERRQEFEASCLAREVEEQRVAELSMYERIEECEDIHDLKRLLHDIVGRLGLE
jgi:hypothetical protein